MSESSSARPLRWWDLGVISAVLVVAVILVFEIAAGAPGWGASLSPVIRAVAVFFPLVAFGVLYLFLGRKVLVWAMLGNSPGRNSHMFLVLAIAAVALGTFCSPMYAVLQAIAYPMVWVVVREYRASVVWSLAVAVSVGLGIFVGIAIVDVNAAIAPALITAPMSFLFAVAMGTWMTQVTEKGERYRETAELLRQTQAEVAALSEAAGASAERERLSRELHDTLTQTLTGLVMLNEQAGRAFDSGDTLRARDRIARSTSAAREAVAEARALVATTQPLAAGGLLTSIARVAARMREDTGLNVECDLEQVTLDRERETVLLRAVQEGLANARRHARATRVRVSIAPADGGGAVLTVEDDGVGPIGDGAPGGFGLSGLADRVRLVGGKVSFGPGLVSGSRLEVSL
ncbi:MAG: histidine kinase [Scrofimicrobium sp.]